ncbi:MAG TPA: PilT/PilU family type 4a pilus ATPase [Thiotrichales bacterium]|nr:PilT/PilU family type 4a pilus ATPase [Thiotrichales bacterium]
MSRINAFLKLARDQGCSDVHFTVGMPPILRHLGQMAPIKYRQLSREELELLVRETMSAATQRLFDSGDDVDYSYQDEEVGRFRVNVYRKLTGMGAAFRVISDRIPRLDDLGLGFLRERLLHTTQGLILVTGPTGTGKSTTLASMIELINNHRRLNIITLEDPVEFVHHSNLSMIIQREVGTHTASFADGLRSSLREDPDVILVGELRDPETIGMALTAAETGHLVLATLHTSSAVKTLARIIDAMPTGQKAQTATLLSQHLQVVISQRLLRTADNRARRAVVEVMVNTPAIANLIISGKTHQLASMLQTGGERGMKLLDDALMEAVKKKQVNPDDAYIHATDKQRFQRFVTDPSILPQISLGGGQ